MAVAYDSSQAFPSTSFQASPFTFSYTVGAGANLLMMETTHNNSSNDVSGITYNGVALTQYNGYSNTGALMQVWYLVSPATGSNLFSVAYSGSATHRAIASSFSGVDTAAPFGTSVSDITTNSTGVTLGAVTSSATGLVYGSIALGNSGKSITAGGTGQTGLQAGTDVDGNLDSAISYQTGAASVVASWTWAGTQRVVAVAIPLLPGGAAPQTDEVPMEISRQEWRHSGGGSTPRPLGVFRGEFG